MIKIGPKSALFDFEDGAGECRPPLDAENNPQLAESKEMGTSVQQPHGAEFCQQLERVDFSPESPGKSPPAHTLISLVRPEAALLACDLSAMA